MQLSFDGSIAGAFVLYIVVMLWLGWRGWRRTRDLSDYLLGGRSLGRWVSALSAGASDMSGWLLLGLPGYAYAAGLESLWLAAGLLAGTWLNWRLVAGRLRRYTRVAGDSLTLPEFLARRFGAERPLLRGVAAVMILFFFLFYTSSGLVAGGRLFETVFGLSYPLAVAAGLAVILLYTAFGGFLAVSWTDLVQGLLMLVALLVVPVAAMLAAEGGTPPAAPPLLDPFTDATGEPLGVVALLSLLAWGLGYFGQPHILARFMAIRDHREVAPARRIAVSWTALCLAGAVATGLAGIAFLDPPLAGADTERVFMLLVQALFHPWLAGVLLAAILAAVMSTADSQLLVASSALAEDFYKAWLRPQASARELVWVGRGAVLLVALVAGLLALDADSRVLELVAWAWAGFGATFGPVILLALFWERMTAAGALAGMVGGGATVIVWRLLEGGWFDLYELAPGFLAGLAAAIVVSRFGSPPPPVLERHRAILAGRDGDRPWGEV
ncbi:MAG TPA: sodium/proline symporter PutP [Gammaproteobacteria bacterium]|nr:sodium/proline symporter PutP [Gammaproteobacteria bacterium]